MPTTTRLVQALRGLLVLAFLAILVLQVMSIPGSLALQVDQDPDFATRRWVLLVVLELELTCVQVVVGCIWRLLGMVQQERIFTDAAFRWVNLILIAIGAGWVVWAGFSGFVLASSDDPGVPLLVGIVLLAGAVVGLLMYVMRALLLQATSLRSDMDAVI